MAEPLSKEEREAIAAEQRVWPWCEQLDRYEATVQVAEAERDDARESVRLLYDERDAAVERAEPCDKCKGSGGVQVTRAYGYEWPKTCPKCKGTGKAS